MQMAAEYLPCHTVGRPNSGARQPRFGGSMHRSSRHRSQYSCNSGQIAGDHRQLEVLVHAFETTIYSLSKPSDRLAPAKVLFDAFADDLVHSVSLVPRSTDIDSAAASSRWSVAGYDKLLGGRAASNQADGSSAVANAPRTGERTAGSKRKLA